MESTLLKWPQSNRQLWTTDTNPQPRPLTVWDEKVCYCNTPFLINAWLTARRRCGKDCKIAFITIMTFTSETTSLLDFQSKNEIIYNTAWNAGLKYRETVHIILERAMSPIYSARDWWRSWIQFRFLQRWLLTQISLRLSLNKLPKNIWVTWTPLTLLAEPLILLKTPDWIGSDHNHCLIA